MTLPPDECRELELAIMAFFDGELPRGDEDAVLAHLAHCATCRDEFHDNQSVRDRLGTLANQTQAPALLRTRVQAALAAEAKATETLARRRRVNRWLVPGSATILAAAAVALAVVGEGPSPSPSSGELASTTVAAEAARQLVRAAPLEVRGAAATPAWVQRHFDAGLALPAGTTALPRTPVLRNGGPELVSPAITPLRATADAAIRLQGARLSTFRGRDAILLQYEVDSAVGVRTMQVLAFAAQDMSWGRIPKTVRGGRDIYFDEHLGVRAVATVDHGYAYVFASSAMSHDELADIVERIHWCQRDAQDGRTRC